MAAQEEKRQFEENVRKFMIDQERREEQKRLEEQERKRIRKKFAENRKLKFETEAARRLFQRLSLLLMRGNTALFLNCMPET